MEQVNIMKYDELTLMKFADGELDDSLADEIESARHHDKELQSYLEVYEATRSDLIRSSSKEAVPSHIYDFIDSLEPTKKHNWLITIVKNNPFKSSIFSAVLASLITMQGTISVLLGAGGSITAAQFALSRSIQVDSSIDVMDQNNDTSSDMFQALSISRIELNTLIENELTNALLKDPKVSYIVISNKGLDTSSTELKAHSLSKSKFTKNLMILGDFRAIDGNNCKIMKLDNQYLIACNSKLLGRKIQSL